MKTIGLITTDDKKIEAFPFSKYWQTACLPVGNQPNIKHTVHLMEEAGLDSIYIIEKYLPKQIRNSLKDHKNIHFLKSLEEFISLLPNDVDVLYIKGNKYVPKQHLKSLLQNRKKFRNGLLSVSKKSLYKNASNHFGVKAENSTVESIYGYTREHYMDYILNGIYLFEGQIYQYFNQTEEGFQNVPAGGMPQLNFYIENLIQEAIHHENIFGIEEEEPVYDLKYPWELLEANVKQTTKSTENISESNGLVPENIHSTASLGDKIILGDNVQIGKNVMIKGKAIIGDNTILSDGVIVEENVQIGSNCHISGYAKISKGTTIGNHCKIGFTAEIFGVFFDGVSAVHQTQFYGIAGKSVDIAAGVNVGSLRFDDQATTHKINGKRMAGNYSNGAFIGDYTRLGINNMLFPGVKIGSNCAIGPGAIIERDVPNQTLVQVQQEKTYSEWGPNRYGWND